jgi:Sulfotransferase domain
LVQAEIPSTALSHITEVTDHAVRGTLSRSEQDIGTVALRINGNIVATMSSEPTFELDSQRNLIGTDRVEVVLIDRAGVPSTILEWGHSGKSLPEQWRAAGRSCLPSLFVLGAAKCGTTSLHAWLDAHPDVSMSRPKEPFFFEAEYCHGPEYYFRKYFGGWKGQRVAGEARHRNLYLPFVPRRIHRFNPAAKLLAILRHPAARAVSHWWFWRCWQKEPLTLAEALRSDLERIEGGQRFDSEAEASRYAEFIYRDIRSPHRTYLDSGYYAEQLERYTELFGKDKLHIVFFEDLAARPKTVMEGIFRFLDVDPAYASQIAYSPLNVSARGALEQVDARTEAWLIEHYRSHNQRLETLLDRPTDTWNRPFTRC